MTQQQDNYTQNPEHENSSSAGTENESTGTTPQSNEPTPKAEPDYKDQYLRLYAEFDNYKKRSQKEKMDWIQLSNKEMMLAMIEVLDDCIRAEEELKKFISSGQAVSKEAIEGVLLIFGKLSNTLAQKGLTHIEVIDKPFDIDEHEAVAEVDSPEEKKGKVLAEAQRGYTLNGKVIKFAKVVVGK